MKLGKKNKEVRDRIASSYCLINPDTMGLDIKEGPEACAGHPLTKQITHAATDRATTRAAV